MFYNESVEFVNIQNYKLNFHTSKKIQIEYIVEEKFKVAIGKDFVGLVPKGIYKNTIDLDKLITYEHVLNGPIDERERRYRMEFSLKCAKNLNYGQDYMFVYSNYFSEVLGASNSFKFVKPAKENLKLEKNNNIVEELQMDEMVHGNNGRIRRGKSNVLSIQQPLVREEGERRIKTEESARNYNNRRLNQECEGKGSRGDFVAFHGFATRSCSNCKRTNHLLQTQSDLYTQVKNLAEENKDLKTKVGQLEQQLELGQAAYQKVCVQLMREREIRLFCLDAPRGTVSSQMAWSYLLVPVFWGFDSWYRPIFTFQPLLLSGPSVSQQMAYLPSDAIAHSNRGDRRLDDKTKLRMKAIMGSQEEKIRMLTDEIKELKSALAEKETCSITKVKAVMKDIGGLTFN